MVLGFYLDLPQTVLFNGNFSSSLKLTGTCYNEIQKTTAFDLTGYTITLRLYRENGYLDYYNETCTITVAASGTWEKAVTSGTLPYAGLYLVDLVLTKSGTQISNLNRVEILIQRGPVN